MFHMLEPANNVAIKNIYVFHYVFGQLFENNSLLSCICPVNFHNLISAAR